MRTRLGLATLVVGVLLAALGGAVTALLGPDGRYVTGPHEVRTDSLVVTRPAVLDWQGLELDVLAELPAEKPVFVGLGNAVDVEDYVGQTRRIVVDGVGRPWDPSYEEVDGGANLDASPVSLDWWLAAEAGLGAAHLSTTLPDETVEVAILPVGEADLTGLRVSLAYGVPHGFAWSLGALLLGLGLALLGVLVWRGVPLRPEPALVWLDDEDDEDEPAVAAPVPAADDAVEEQVVYVLVDDDGTEHEITAEEAAAAGYEVVEEVVVEDAPTPEGEPR
ncbi:hypothetical protein [Aeromicrobium sp. IC_218]|uniref:hypothetical protein n=1 Tax=Aeromicrobium sp. IC_218 TaxID=2545468 RepID=UPI0010388964|nr:hypothetical protein [Aeromicrobium sp. IC_218]TCI97465.1 hypothetical protein E0W78_11755 [Aeromicrobium sp. IC_218]